MGIVSYMPMLRATFISLLSLGALSAFFAYSDEAQAKPAPKKTVAKTIVLKKPDANQLKALDELFELIDMNESIEQSWYRVTRSLRIKTIREKVKEHSKNKKLSRKEVFDEALLDTEAMLKRFSTDFEADYKETLLAIYRHVYSKFYTAADMKALIAFYKSDAGKKATANDSKIVKRSMIKLIKQLRPEAEKLLAKRLQAIAGDGGANGGAREDMDVFDEILE